MTRRSGVYLEIPKRNPGNRCQSSSPQLSKIIFGTGSTVTASLEDRYLALQIRQTKRAAKPLPLAFAASLLHARELKLFKLPSYTGFANS